MGLDETQIKFLEDFILKRKIRRLGTEHDQPRVHDAETAGPVDPDDVHRIAAAAARLTTPEGALPDDVAALAAHRRTISGFLDDPATQTDLRSAAREVKAMAETRAAASQRAREDAERRRDLGAALARAAMAAVAELDAEALDPDATDLPAAGHQIASSVSGTPTETALRSARDATEKLKRDVARANERAKQDRKERAAERTSVLSRLGGISAIDDGTGDERERFTALASAVTMACAAEAPSRAELEKAARALADLTDHAASVRKDIDMVRRPRFEKAQAEHEAVRQISLDMPEGCPEDERAKLVAEQRALVDLLAPRIDWSKVTGWDAEDLIDINERRDRLSREADDLRDRVSRAADALRQASETARTAMAPTGGGFSEAQTAQMQEMFRAASEAAAANLLQSERPLAELRRLARHAADTARLRQAALRRIAALPDTPPAGASPAQRAEWTRLRNAALAAADQVLST